MNNNHGEIDFERGSQTIQKQDFIIGQIADNNKGKQNKAGADPAKGTGKGLEVR